MKKPNILWLLTDHHVFKHHGVLGGPGPTLPTGKRLAKEGITFNQAYTVCPVCTPARASMLTGLYPHRHGMVMNNGECGSRLDFEPDVKLISHYLSRAGYRVGYFGKWHCGEERIPEDYGFEGWSMPGYGFAYQSDEYEAYLAELKLPPAKVDVEWRLNKSAPRERGLLLKDEPNPYEYSSGILTTPVETHESYFVTHLANKWLEQRARDSEPFFLRVDTWGPHQPYYVASPFAQSVNPKEIPEYPNFASDLSDKPMSHKIFRDIIIRNQSKIYTWNEWQPVLARCYEHTTQVDSALGRVVDILERLGLAHNTLLIYTADHGDAIASHGGVFDKDSLMVEETTRIPCVLRWPGHIRPGTVSDKFITNMDIVPTILEAAQADIPFPMDGKSFFNLMQNPETAFWREDLMLQHYGHGQPDFQRLLRYKQYKYVARLTDLDEMYNFNDDPFELKNLVNDPGMKEILKELRERLLRQMEEHDDNSRDANLLKHNRLNNE